MLLKRPDIDVNAASPTARWNPLLLASSTGRVKTLGALLQHPNIDRDYRIRNCTALYHAAINERIPCLKLLLQSGCNPNANRPIHRAVDANKLESVKTLMNYSAEANFTDSLGSNILHAGSVNNRPEIMRFFLHTGVDVGVNDQGNNGETPLHGAVCADLFDTVSVLLEYGARTDIVNASGRSPVKMAMDAGHTRTIELLRKARDKEQVMNEQAGTGGLSKADTFSTQNELPFPLLIPQASIESIRLRLASMSPEEVKKATLDTIGQYTALHVACRDQRVDVINLLLHAGADANQADAFGRAPLIIACQTGDFDAVQALVKRGADIKSCVFDSCYPWEIALTKRRVESNHLPACAATNVHRPAQRGVDNSLGMGSLSG